MTVLLVIASIVCIAIVIIYSGAFLHLILTNGEALAVGAIMTLALLVFGAMF